MFLFPAKRELMEHITYSGNLNGVQTQPASSSGKDEPPPKKTHVVSIAMFHQLGILGRVVCSIEYSDFSSLLSHLLSWGPKSHLYWPQITLI